MQWLTFFCMALLEFSSAMIESRCSESKKLQYQMFIQHHNSPAHQTNLHVFPYTPIPTPTRPSQELSRSQKDCRSKWTTLQRSVSIQHMRKGPFTAEEDEIVLRRVAEWGEKGQVRVVVIVGGGVCGRVE